MKKFIKMDGLLGLSASLLIFHKNQLTSIDNQFLKFSNSKIKF